MADACRPGVVDGEGHGVAAHVRGQDRGRQLPEHAPPRLVAQRRPQLHIVIHPALEPEPLPRQSRWAFQGDPRGFDRQRSGAAERIGKGTLAAPACQQDQGRGQGFVERSARQDGPIAALVQRFAGAFEAERRLIAVNVQVKADHRLLDIDAGPPAAAVEELVADRVLGAQGGVFRVGDPRIADVAIDGQRVLGREVLRPVDRAHGVVKLIGRGDGRFQDGLQDANSGAQPEIGLVEQGSVALEMNAAAARCHLGGVQGPQLIRQDGFDAPAQVAKKRCPLTPASLSSAAACQRGVPAPPAAGRPPGRPSPSGIEAACPRADDRGS